MTSTTYDYRRCASVTTHELREGDIVWDTGMRLLIDEPLNRRATDNRTGGGDAVWTNALITNWDDITDPFIRHHASDNVYTPEHGWRRVETRRWIIQGNRWATWMRERRT